MTNSTVDEYILSNTNNRKVECNNQFVCDLKCNDSKDITFITNSISVRIECTQCDYFKVYAEHANNINIRFSDAQYAYFHLEHALNINMTLINTQYSVIYAQHAQTFRFQTPSTTYYTIFYLDYVSNEIHFECTDIEYKCYAGEIMISAAFANFFKWKTPFKQYQSSFLQNHIFCPSHADDVCVIDSSLIEYSNIYISNVSHNVRPLNVTTSSNSSRVWRDFDLWCNNNQNGFYQSFTEIYTEFINDNTTQQICTDIASPCCYLNDIDNNNSNDIFCDDPDTLCMIECTQNGTDCSSNSIYSSDSTIDLNVICIEPYSCYQTTIYCPSSIQSLCSVSCLDYKSCEDAIIKYNTNNEYMTLECLSEYSCYHLKAYIDRSDNDHSAEIHNVANITCVGCPDASFIVNTEMDALNIICMRYGCRKSKIYAKMVQKLRINCTMYPGCNYIEIYGKTNEKNTVQLSCNSSSSCWGVNIINGFEYELDYISVIGPYRNESLLSIENIESLSIYCSSVDTEFGILWAYTNTYRQYSSDTTSAYMCDPFSDHWNGIYECNAGESCDYDFYDAEYIMIYANNAKSISISCKECRYFNINAQNASSVSLNCTGYSKYIKVNADNVDTFSLECGSCRYLIIGAMHSRNVIIDVYKISASEINVIYNTNAFTLRCRSYCKDLDLLIPSNPSSKTSIKCDGDYACLGINIHSNNGSWNDITDLTIISCDGTASEYTPDNYYWILFCPSSSHAGHSVDDGLYSYGNTLYTKGNMCKYILSLQTTFCHCDRFDHQQLTEYLSGGTIMFDPFATECFELEMGQHHMRSLISLQSFVVGIVSLCAIFVWCIIAIKNVLFRFFRPAKYYEIIEPPSLYLLRYIYCSDLFVWCAQIYILIVCWVIYEYSKGVCESLPSTSDEEIINRCNVRWFCVEQNDVCGVDPSILLFYIVSLVSLCIIIISLFLTYADDHEYLQSHCVHYRCCDHSRQWNDIIQNEYLQRTFWPYSTPIWIYIFIRYCVFFSSVFLMFYFTYDEDDINFNIRIQWYDIFPVLLLVITNEGLKKRYRMLPSYDMGTHILHILSEHYGRHIASIIVSFVGENVLPEVQMVDITINERTKLNHDQSEQ